MNIELRTEGTRAVLTLNGPLTPGDNIERLRDEIDDLLRQGFSEFVLNLGGVSTIDSATLGQLVQVYTTIARKGGSLELVGLTKSTGEMLSAVKLGDSGAKRT